MGKAVEILIIDDDDLVLASLSDYLAIKNFRPYTAATARDGIAHPSDAPQIPETTMAELLALLWTGLTACALDNVVLLGCGFWPPAIGCGPLQTGRLPGPTAHREEGCKARKISQSASLCLDWLAASMLREASQSHDKHLAK